MTGHAPLVDERTRIVEACIEVVGEVGYKRARLEAIVDRAGIDRVIFARHFADLDACFLAAWEAIDEEYMGVALAAFASEEAWADRIRAVGYAILDFWQENPARGRVHGGGRDVGSEALQKRFDATADAFVELVDMGRQELDDPESLSRATAEGLAGAVFEQVVGRLLRGAEDDLTELLPQIMFMVLRPYLGLQVAMAELQRPPR